MHKRQSDFQQVLTSIKADYAVVGARHEQFLEKLRGNRFVIYPAGMAGRIFYFYLAGQGASACAFGDSYKRGTFCGNEIISPEQLRDKPYSDSTVVISGAYYNEIRENLQKEGFQGEIIRYDYRYCFWSHLFSELRHYPIKRIEDLFPYFERYDWLYSRLADDDSRKAFTAWLRNLALGEDAMVSFSPQYFEKGIICLGDNEVFFDVGCADGRDTAEFIKQTGGQYQSVYAFEPDPNSYRTLKSTFGENDRISFCPCALSDSVGQQPYLVDTFNPSWSRIDETGESLQDTTIIDAYYAEHGVEPTFIKMDIEGAELAALSGGRRIIASCKPRLAICIYHRPDDPIKMPQYIASLNPGYRFYFRHYDVAAAEGVLYAI